MDFPPRLTIKKPKHFAQKNTSKQKPCVFTEKPPESNKPLLQIQLYKKRTENQEGIIAKILHPGLCNIAICFCPGKSYNTNREGERGGSFRIKYILAQIVKGNQHDEADTLF